MIRNGLAAQVLQEKIITTLRETSSIECISWLNFFFLFFKVRHKQQNVKIVSKKSGKETEDTGGIFMGGSKYPSLMD